MSAASFLLVCAWTASLAATAALLVPGLFGFGKKKGKDAEAPPLPPVPSPPGQPSGVPEPPRPFMQPFMEPPAFDDMDDIDRKPAVRASPEMMMGTVRQLETFMEKLGYGSMDDEEKKWFFKAKSEVESLKRAIASGSTAEAARHLRAAEMCIKMIELNVAGR